MSVPVTAAAQVGAEGQSTSIPVPGLRRIFASSFEESIRITGDPSGQRAWIRGVGSSSPWDRLDHVFELVAPGAFGRLVKLKLDDSRAFSGRRSLYMRQEKEEAGAQARLQFFSDDKTFGSEIFTRRHYFIPSSNLSTLVRNDQSTSIGGTRESRGSSLPAGHPGADFSMPLYLVRKGPNLIFAQGVVDYSAGLLWSQWTRPPRGLFTHGHSVACPLDRWFRLDIYILRHQSAGQIKVWIDDRLIFDLNGIRTKNDTNEWFTKLADIDSEPAPFEAWVDDVEVWAR